MWQDRLECLSPACEIMSFLRTIGSDSIDIVVYVSEKALFSATARHLRVRHALNYHGDFVDDLESFDWEPPRSLQRSWDSKSIEWAMNQLATATLAKDVHLGIKALRTSADDLPRRVDAFMVQSVL